jgi:N6-L-threonylcarbamoyladenine synthase
MPCFIVGHSLASVVANMYNVPLYICSHQKNHIGAALYSGNCAKLLDEEFFAFHISGGTTDILLCKCTNGVLDISKVGGTADISCGQLIDRAGVAMNLPFPCGKYIENCSTGVLKGNIKISNTEYMYNFSGFENKVADKLSNGETISQISDFVLDVVASFVMDSIKKLRNNYKHIPVLLSGGVMSNKYISSFICENVKDVYFANAKYSSDNALGTAFMCAYERGLFNE